QAPPQLTGDHLGHQRLAALPGAHELHHVHAVVVGLDQARQRTALAQRQDVTRPHHFSQHAGKDTAAPRPPPHIFTAPRTGTGWSARTPRPGAAPPRGTPAGSARPGSPAAPGRPTPTARRPARPCPPGPGPPGCPSTPAGTAGRSAAPSPGPTPGRPAPPRCA